MNELPSAEFRKTYARLTEDTAVTVNGHVIGFWSPVDPRPFLQTKEVPSPGNWVGAEPTTQQRRDDLLRKINRGK